MLFIEVVILFVERKINVKKTAFVYILIGLWITIGVLFLLMLVIHTTYYLGRIVSFRGITNDASNIAAGLNFYLILQFLLFLFIVISSFINVYGIFMKKSWSWLFGIILSSFLAYYIFQGIYIIGYSIIVKNFGQMFSDLYTGFQFILYVPIMFFIPSLLFILTRPYVKAYFRKPELIIPKSY